MYERIKLVLSNNFHNTETTIFGEEIINTNIITITRTQAIRARRKLCGVAGCTCGDVAGCRPQMVEDSQGARLRFLR